MKKIVSLLSALAIFSSMAVTSFAEYTYKPSAQAAANSNPIVEGYVDVAQSGDANCIINFKLTNCEELSFAEDWGYYTSNGISSFTVKVTLDTEVFNVGSSRISTTYANASTSGAKSADLTFTFNPTAVASYTYELPETLFMIRVPYNTGYDVENIPDDAISFGDCILCYSKYEDSDVRTYYTRYGVNGIGEVDYPLTVKFEGTAAEGGEEGGSTVTPVAMDAGVEIAEGPHAGKTSVSAPEAVAVADFAKIEITNDVDTSKTLEWTAPTTLGAGKTNVLAVLVYDKAAMAGSTFTVKYLNAASEAIKIFTHAVTE